MYDLISLIETTVYFRLRAHRAGMEFALSSNCPRLDSYPIAFQNPQEDSRVYAERVCLENWEEMKKMNEKPVRASLKSVACALMLALWAWPMEAIAQQDKPGQQKSNDDKPRPDLTEMSVEDLLNIKVETVYGASRYQQKVTEAPASITIISADEIKKYGYRTLADILRSIRGVYVTNDRNYSYIGVRGVARPGDYNTRVLLLIDGHRINDSIYDLATIGTEFPLDVDLIERVEFVRGPSSSLYGTNAFFGVINIITKRGRDLKGLEVSGEAGNFASYKGSIS